MKAPIALPFIKKGEEVPSTGVTAQAVIGFMLPFILILLAGIIIFFMINARIDHGRALPAALLATSFL